VSLGGQPAKRQLAAIDPEAIAPDEFALGKRVVYLKLPNGVQGARIGDWRKPLGIEATQRNWNTTTKLAELAGHPKPGG
jgi:uncharacterized protein (DUF1697 family)